MSIEPGDKLPVRREREKKRRRVGEGRGGPRAGGREATTKGLNHTSPKRTEFLKGRGGHWGSNAGEGLVDT